MKKINTLCAALTISCVCAAQIVDKSIDLNPVIVTGTGTYHKAEDSPVAVKVISAKELKDAHVSSLSEALQQLTTSFTSHTNGMGTFVNFNGVSDDYITILLNGKRLSGDDRFSRISMDNIKRIEILSGAASVLYGSDAIAGVINIITDDSKDMVSASASTRVASKGRINNDINVDVNAGKFSSSTSYTHRQAENWQVNKYQEFMEGDNSVLKLTGRPMSQGFHSNNFDQKFDYRFNDQWSVYARGNYYENITDRPKNATYYKQSQDKKTGEYKYTSTQAYTYDLRHESYSYGAGARWVPTSKVHVYLDMYSDNFSSLYDYWQTADKESYDELRKRTRYYNETLKGIFRINDWNKLSSGLEMVQETLKSASDNINFEQTNTYNAFAQDEINIVKGLEAVIAARYTYNDNFGSRFSPNVALFYHIGGFRARASYAAGYKTPTLSQMYATDQAKTTSRYTINNTSLRPETNDFWNANLEYSNKWMSISLNGFINRIHDMINYRTLTAEEIAADPHLKELSAEWKTIRQRDNIDEATLRGISTNVKFLLPAGFSVGGGYAYTYSNTSSDTPVDKSVEHVGNASVSWDKTWRNYHLNINFNGHMQGRRYSSTYGYADPYSQWDLNTRHVITLRQCILEPGIGIENIFNKRDTQPWSSNYSTITPGRSLYVSLALKFNK